MGNEAQGYRNEPVDSDTIALIESRLHRTHAQRFADAVQMARFVQSGREKLQRVASRGSRPCAPAKQEFDPLVVLAALDAAGVHCVVIGGIAAALHGDPGVTLDLDITPAGNRDNLERLVKALRELRARLRAEGVPGGRAFDGSPPTFESLGGPDAVNLTTRAGDLGVIFRPTGTAGFDDLRDGATEVDVTPRVSVRIASLEDVIRPRRAAGRLRDREALPRLEALLTRISRPPPAR